MSKLDEILDTYWDEIKKGEKLIGTIQKETKKEIKDLFNLEVEAWDDEEYINIDEFKYQIDKL